MAAPHAAAAQGATLRWESCSSGTEPQLKLKQLELCSAVLANDAISCLCLSDKLLALGTEQGRVHVLDYSGNQVRARTRGHTARAARLAPLAALRPVPARCVRAMRPAPPGSMPLARCAASWCTRRA